MKRFLRKHLSTALIGVALFATTLGIGLVSTNAITSAQTTELKNAACQGVQMTGGGDCNNTNPNDPNSAAGQVNSTLATVINILSLIVGVAAVIMIIIGGFRYVISNGDSGNVNSAKNTILYAIIGLVVVALAQFIVQFVLSKL